MRRRAQKTIITSFFQAKMLEEDEGETEELLQY